ncbi:hypothetical protein ACQ4PT_003484 [Festuca glaucescens]
MVTTSFPSVLFYFCMFLLCHGSMAQLFGQSFTMWQSSRQGGLRGCKFDRLQAFEPLRQMRSQAGITEYFDEQNEQFRCTGVSVIRRVIEPQGLLLPQYHNAPALVYILQAIYFFDVNSNANQLEPRQKEFLLAGNNKREQQPGQNIFSGFSVQLLSEAFGISQQAAQRIQSQNDQRGEIIRVPQGLQFFKPIVSQQEKVEQQAYQPIQHREGQSTQYPEGQST